MYVIGKEIMTKAEGLTVGQGISWFDLMVNAGRAAADFIKKDTVVVGKSIGILCGKGNNGGDGFVVAKELSLAGANVSVVLALGYPATESAKKAFDSMPNDVTVLDMEQGIDYAKNGGWDITVDAIFGTGCSGEKPKDALAQLIKEVKGTNYAIDLPSLMACDTGKGWQYALPTKNTLTFGGRKFCHVLPHSADKCGRVQVLDIGISTENLKKAGATITEILPPVFEKRAKTSHKNDYGIGLSVCGSYGMPGAAIISARAALRAGIGVLKLACIEENYIPCAVSTPEAVLIPCKSWGKTYSLENAETLKEQLKTAHALLIGCGLGISEDAKGLVKELLLSTQVPTVLDADGINLIASDIELLKDVKAPLVLTPHAGEMARLLKTTSAQIEQNRIEIAADFSKKYGVYTVLKGANTIAATPRGDLSVNVMGNPGMATAGSGDMLAGIMLALLSQGMAVSDAVKGAVWLHSAAGDRAANRLGERAMLPTDMIEELHHFL